MNDFKSKMLYDQTCVTEEGVNVLSTVYAISWTYPGAITKTTARIRLTCIYSYEGANFTAHAGTLEKWRNEGWSLIDEYHDDRDYFATPHDFRARMLSQAQSFLTGVELRVIDSAYVPTDDIPFPSEPSSPSKKNGLSIVEYKKRKKEKSKDVKKKNPKGDDDDLKENLPEDFDWI